MYYMKSIYIMIQQSQNFGSIKFEPQKLYHDVMKAIDNMTKQCIILALQNLNLNNYIMM